MQKRVDKKLQNETKKRFIDIFRQFVKFGIVGVINTIVSYGIYSALVYLGLYYVVANVMAYIVGTIVSYILNSNFVFKKSEGECRSIWKTFIKMCTSYAFVNLLLQSLLLALLVEKMGLSKYIAPLFILCITVPLNFVLNKFWAFKKKISSQQDIPDSFQS